MKLHKPKLNPGHQLGEPSPFDNMLHVNIADRKKQREKARSPLFSFPDHFPDPSADLGHHEYESDCSIQTEQGTPQPRNDDSDSEPDLEVNNHVFDDDFSQFSSLL